MDGSIYRSSKKDRLVQVFFDIIAIVVVISVLAIVNEYLEPTIQGFYCNDSEIFYHRRSNSLSDIVLMMFATFGPMLVVLIVEVMNMIFFFKPGFMRTPRRQFMICVFHGMTLFILGLGITLLVTEVCKRWTGKLRPYFIDVCRPDLSKVDCMNKIGEHSHFYNYINTGGDFCKGKAESVKEARLSFPSGHASFAFYSMFFVILYLQARFVLLRLRYLRPLLQTAALIAACVSSLSRISDHQHHTMDVIAGALVGTLIAFYMTIVSGRVIWIYAMRIDHYDFDLKRDSKLAGNLNNNVNSI